MHPNDLDLSKLTTAERIQLAEDLWDSVAVGRRPDGEWLDRVERRPESSLRPSAVQQLG